MATLTRLQMRSLARLYVNDEDTTDPGLEDADYNGLLDQAHQDIASIYPQNLPSILTPTLTLVANDERAVWTSNLSYGIRYLTRCEIAGASANRYGARLEKISIGKMRHLQENGGEVAGTPRFWAETKGLTTTVWNIYVYPVASATPTLQLWGVAYPATFSSDSSTTHLGEDVSRWLAKMAAIEAAIILGRDDAVVRRLQDGLPERIATFQKLRFATSRPLPDPMKEQGVG